MLTGLSWCEEREEEEETSHSLFHHAELILHNPFDETGEQTWEESGDLWPTEVCQPLKPVALLMNSQCNHTERSTVCGQAIDPLSSYKPLRAAV